ncbi:hypothetical protein Dip510_001349 [Elusimicrobium posterum]|uniref:phage/plasmid replication domain-containing protein n=1 Tax=Elusimicrobium posterum TaxID=3116653 RepID=UPI003C751E5C
MIDTVRLTIKTRYKITEYDYFYPSASGLFGPRFYSFNGRHEISCVQNPSAKDTFYKPRLTLSRNIARGSYPTLSVELSLPKLMYFNNLQELTDTDFPKVLDILQYVLREMGVEVSTEVLAAASISRLDLSKNIVMPDGVSCASVLRRLAKGSLNRIKCKEKSYEPSGAGVHYFCDSFQVVFYDKQQEMKQDRWNVGVAKDSKFYGKDILRYELQLKDTKAIRRKLNIDNGSELIFKDLFSEAISKKILRHFWDEINKSLPLEAPKDTIFEHVSPNSKLGGFIAYVDAFGAEAAKAKLLKETGDNRAYKKLMEELDSLRNRLPHMPSPLDVITEALEAFEPIV